MTVAQAFSRGLIKMGAHVRTNASGHSSYHINKDADACVGVVAYINDLYFYIYHNQPRFRNGDSGCYDTPPSSQYKFFLVVHKNNTAPGGWIEVSDGVQPAPADLDASESVKDLIAQAIKDKKSFLVGIRSAEELKRCWNFLHCKGLLLPQDPGESTALLASRGDCKIRIDPTAKSHEISYGSAGSKFYEEATQWRWLTTIWWSKDKTSTAPNGAESESIKMPILNSVSEVFSDNTKDAMLVSKWAGAMGISDNFVGQVFMQANKDVVLSEAHRLEEESLKKK